MNRAPLFIACAHCHCSREGLLDEAKFYGSAATLDHRTLFCCKIDEPQVKAAAA